MATFFDNPSCLTRLAGVINILGRSFTSVTSVLHVVFMFVRGDRAVKGDAENVEQSLPNAGNDTQIQPLEFQFSAFVENVSFLYPEIFAGSGSFKAFDDFCKDKGYSCSAIFVTNRHTCRVCGRNLLVCDDAKDVIVYHMTRGTYIGSRFTKKCSKCKIQEHYGFYKRDSKRMFDDDCLTNEFLLTTEDTAIDMQLLKYLDQEVVQGACPFLLKAKVYNSVHGYSESRTEEDKDVFGDGSTGNPSKKKR